MSKVARRYHHSNDELHRKACDELGLEWDDIDKVDRKGRTIITFSRGPVAMPPEWNLGVD